MRLSDQHGRTIRKLRVALLDACNFRCFYCMPLRAQFMPQDALLSVDRMATICRALVDYGISEIRLTGGEPTMRQEFREVVMQLSALPIQKLAMTTNGLLLGQHLEFLRDTRCVHLNVSLDSLQEDKFHRITRTRAFAQVMNAIERASDFGFHLKINVVLMRGHNDDEIMDFVHFSAATGIEVRFLEVMRIGQVKDQSRLLVSAAEAIERMESQVGLRPMVMAPDSTSFNFLTDSGAQIGFIASETRPFCGGCSRWRLSANGFLRACLMSKAGVDLRDVDLAMLDETLSRVLRMKPADRIDAIAQDMHQIGG